MQHLPCRWDLSFDGGGFRRCDLFACCERAFRELDINDLVGDLTNTLTETVSVLIEQLECISEFLVYGREETLDALISFNPNAE